MLAAKRINKAVKLALIKLLFFTVFLTAAAGGAFAQSAFNIAQTYTILPEEEVVSGDLISFDSEEETYRLSRVAYDPNLIGAVVAGPQLVYTAPEEDDAGTPIADSGKILVNVTTLNGEIKQGEILTSSPIPGKAQKATEPRGTIIGTALRPFSADSGEEIEYEGEVYRSGKILIDMDISQVFRPGGIGFYVDRLFLSLLGSVQAAEGTTVIFRYALAALIAGSAFLVSFFAFGRNVTKGIEAIGRNPLAKTQIQAMIVLNIGLIALISIGAVILSLAIIRL